MSRVQRFLLTIVPKSWRASIIRESKRWRIRCLTCQYSQSVWDAGGVRWKAYSRGKRICAACPCCGRLRCAAVEREE